MGFPDRIERTVEPPHPPQGVGGPHQAEGLAAGSGQQAAIDLRRGGEASTTWDHGQTADMRVERVEEPTVFGYTWHIYGVPIRIRAAPMSSSCSNRPGLARG